MSQRKLLMESLSLTKNPTPPESQVLDPLLLTANLGTELMEDDGQSKPLYEAAYSEASSTNTYQLESAAEVKVKAEEDVGEARRARQRTTTTIRVRPKRYKCMECNKSVESPSKLVRHMRTHEIQTQIIDSHRLYTCNYCNIRFRKVKDMRAHIKACSQAHGQDFQKFLKKPPVAGAPRCVFCDTDFNSDAELTQHYENFHAEHRSDEQQ